MFESEEDAARQYDRALILEKVRAACGAPPQQSCCVGGTQHHTQGRAATGSIPLQLPPRVCLTPSFPPPHTPHLPSPQGRTAKTNFPVRDYEREVAEYEAHLLAT